MDEETQIKIENLAKNMKEMHLVSTIEEARQRAKEIILSTSKQGEKSIKELMDEAQGKERAKQELLELKQKIQEKEKELELLKQEMEKKQNISKEPETEEKSEETGIEVTEPETTQNM